MLGSASVIVLDETVSIPRAATRLIEFFRHESCGKCTPCREGTPWLLKTLTRIAGGRRRARRPAICCCRLSGEIAARCSARWATSRRARSGSLK